MSEIAAPTLAFVAHPSVPARTLKELIAIAQKSPGKLNMAIAGATGEIAGNAIMQAAKIEFKNIPYKVARRQRLRCCPANPT